MFSHSKPIRAIPLALQKPQLPPNFADKLLELETQLGFELSISLVSSLMQLYSSAIEYYESVQDRRYLHYKDRLQSLLSRKDVLDILSGPSTRSPQPALKDSSSSRSPDMLRNRFSKRGEDQPQPRPCTVNLDLSSKLNPDQAISEHLQESSTASSNARASIRRQEGDKLQERLQARRRANSLKPQKTSKESPRGSKLEMFQKEMEEIMEKYAEDKIFKVQAIRKKFSDMKNLGNEAGLKTWTESEMKKEIDSAQIEILRERQEKIEMIRHKYEGK